MPNVATATAADYSEALLVARRAASVLILVLLLMLLVQLGIFFTVKYGLTPDDLASITGHAVVTTQPATSQPSVHAQRLGDLMQYVCGVSILGSLILTGVLAVTLFIIIHIMLVGRLIGVGKVTSAFVWSFVLLVLLFPWQAFLTAAVPSVHDVIVPGALFTWPELVDRVHFKNDFSDGEHIARTVLTWVRFVGAPLLAVYITLMIRIRSNRGLRMAMGEDEILNALLNEEK